MKEAAIVHPGVVCLDRLTSELETPHAGENLPLIHQLVDFLDLLFQKRKLSDVHFLIPGYNLLKCFSTILLRKKPTVLHVHSDVRKNLIINIHK